jgi:uncharacterized membrane protein YfcA
VVPGAVAGLLVGATVARRLPPEQVRRVTLLVAGLGSALAIARGLAG